VTLRVGIINIMPRAEAYEPHLLRPLAAAPVPVEPVWVRLESHTYGSSDRERITRRYRPFHAAGPLDGLIVTGAPVEELPFEEVHYWPELRQILEEARGTVAGTLGLCWGGLALARLVGVGKRSFPRKLFGVFAHRNLAPAHPLAGELDDLFWCAHSRHSGFDEVELEQARRAGAVTILAAGEEAGSTLVESADRRYLMHLGHPEYEPARLLEEWRRDRELGRTDVGAPANLDLEAPLNTWRGHRNGLFARWLAGLRAQRQASALAQS
jgi:homoserine O-succinyltransferase